MNLTINSFPVGVAVADEVAPASQRTARVARPAKQRRANADATAASEAGASAGPVAGEVLGSGRLSRSNSLNKKARLLPQAQGAAIVADADAPAPVPGAAVGGVPAAEPEAAVASLSHAAQAVAPAPAVAVPHPASNTLRVPGLSRTAVAAQKQKVTRVAASAAKTVADASVTATSQVTQEPRTIADLMPNDPDLAVKALGLVPEVSTS